MHRGIKHGPEQLALGGDHDSRDKEKRGYDDTDEKPVQCFAKNRENNQTQANACNLDALAEGIHRICDAIAVDLSPLRDRAKTRPRSLR